MTAVLTITVGEFQAFVDADYADLVVREKWHLQRSRGLNYAVTSDARLMHRMVLGVSDPTAFVDHRDGNGLNNVLSNLRIATHTENMRNRRKSRSGAADYKGVWVERDGRIRACIRMQNRTIHLGAFGSQQAAAIAYDDAARKLFGEFARLNFPSHGEIGCLS